MNQRFVYLMPGANNQSKVGNLCLINYLDTGSTNQFTGDKNSRAYGTVIAMQKWEQLEVNNPDFVKSMPTAGIQLNNTEMLIFGGDKTTTFIFDTREVAAVGRTATINTCKPTLSCRARFGFASDYVARSFGNFMYLIDAADQNLHVYSVKDQGWNSQKLNELAIN